MSEKEIDRLQIMGQIEKKQISQTQASEQLGVSVRQVKRLWQRYKKDGAQGLINKSRGKPSHNQLKQEVKQKALDLILEHYRDFGPTLATEKLVEKHGVTISVERVRQMMVAEGVWKPHRRRKMHLFQMRERRACFGELVQIDGSDYDWFEGRSPRCTLLVFVDDATGQLVELRFVPHESFFAYCDATKSYIERYGKPLAFYSDKHGIFHLNTPKTSVGDGMTHFSRAMYELDIQIICANTPQAKGRVERANQTLQDRLPKEMRLQGISSPEEANAWLPIFMAEYNQRFAVSARSQVNAHRPLLPSENLDRILCRKEVRCLSINLTFQYHKTVYQIITKRPQYAMRKATITVLENSNGDLTVLYKNVPTPFQIFCQQQDQACVVPSKSIDVALQNASKAHKPAADHPWGYSAKKSPPSKVVS